MNTVNTVSAWLNLAPQLLGLIVAIEGLFPHKTGKDKLDAFSAVATQAVTAVVGGQIDTRIVQHLNEEYAANKVTELHADGTFKSAE